MTSGRAPDAVAGSFADVSADEPYPGVTRRVVDAERATVTAYSFRPRAAFPRHSHPQEQITLVQRGDVEFAVGDTVHRLTAGAWSVVKPGAEHGLTAGDQGADILAVIVPRRGHPDAYTVVSE